MRLLLHGWVEAPLHWKGEKNRQLYPASKRNGLAEKINQENYTHEEQPQTAFPQLGTRK